MNLNLTTATRVGLNLLAVLGAVVALYLGKSVFVPLVIAVLLAGMSWPTVAWLNSRLRFPWGFSCLLVVAGLVVLNLLVSFGFFLAVNSMLQELPSLRYSEGQKDLYKTVWNRVNKVWPLAPSPDVSLDNPEKSKPLFPEEPKDSKAFDYIQQTLSEGTYIKSALGYIGYYANNWLWQWVLVMFMLLFLLVEGKMLSRRVVEIFGPSKEAQAKAVETLGEMAAAVRTYLVWRTLVNFAIGVVLGLVYQWIFQMKQPWTWALLTSVACYVPYLGPIFAGMPPAVDAFLSSPSPWYALGVIVFYVGVITIEGYVLVPVVMGRHMELNATTVLLACLFWELVWDLPGLFLAMPLMAALKAICAHVPGWRPWANLMSSNDAVPPEKVRSAESIELLEDTQLLTTAERDALVTKGKSLLEKK
jgi:predicted PurR-regulated permease PerM